MLSANEDCALPVRELGLVLNVMNWIIELIRWKFSMDFFELLGTMFNR